MPGYSDELQRSYCMNSHIRFILDSGVDYRYFVTIQKRECLCSCAQDESTEKL